MPSVAVRCQGEAEGCGIAVSCRRAGKRAADISPPDRYAGRKGTQQHAEQFLVGRRAADDQDLSELAPLFRQGAPQVNRENGLLQAQPDGSPFRRGAVAFEGQQPGWAHNREHSGC